MEREMHLFIIWSKSRFMEKEILEDMKKRFDIIQVHPVTWEKDNFSRNLTRFYGENLPKNSNKEKVCGNETFLLVTVWDREPLYRPRRTSHGVDVVNARMFDAKEMYRKWTKSGHGIHGTNSLKEVKHDILLLTGLSYEDYIAKYADNNSSESNIEFTTLLGENGFETVKDVLYVLNHAAEYVILRNFENFPEQFQIDEHADIDLLTDNYYALQCLLNARPAHKSKYRVQNVISIAGKKCCVDIRHFGDCYYDIAFEKAILQTKVYDKKGFYKPSEEMHLYSLIYHGLIHKKKLSKTYSDIFNGYVGKNITEEELFERLTAFMKEKEYVFVEPKDYSVYFNPVYVKKKMSFKKFYLKALHKVMG